MRVLIVPNIDNPRAVTAALELSSWLAAEGHERVMLAADADASGLADLGVAADALDTPDLVVALGGDGTILRAVHATDGVDVPVLGINLGRLGFLSGADSDEMTGAVGAALAGEARVDRLATLEAEVHGEGAPPGVYRALNEVYLGRGGPSVRVVEFAIEINGRELMRFMCDGLIVATPTGSTAYALSMGGPFVAPSVCGNVLVPVGAHTLAQRPFILGPDDVVDITCPNPARSEACMAVDGMQMRCMPFRRVRVRGGRRQVALVRPHGLDFYDVVRGKFLGR